MYHISLLLGAMGGGGNGRMEGAYDIPIANKLLLHYPQAMTHFWAMDERATCHKAE